MSQKLKEILNISKIIIGFDFSKKTRSPKYVAARSVFFKAARVLTNMPYQKIADVFEKDHATVIHGIKLFDNETVHDPKMSMAYKDITESCIALYDGNEEDIRTENAIITIATLRSRNRFLTAKMDAQRISYEREIESIKSKQIEITTIYEQLDTEEKRRALYNVRTIKKVSDKMKTQVLR
ncbi:MAG TPA: helix-turn-helix domain-containing protein [Pricia sp.]|nr:helix-turn-helix domain-containing protein [Pricia sp.]